MGMAFIYDIFRIFRKLVKHTAFFVYLEDVIYWIIVSFAMFYFMLSQNYGEIRIFTIIGAAIGAVLYLAILSPTVMKVSIIVIDFLIHVITAAIGIILAPIKLSIKIISIPLKIIVKLLKKPAKICKNLLQKSVTCVKMKSRKVFYTWNKKGQKKKEAN